MVDLSRHADALWEIKVMGSGRLVKFFIEAHQHHMPPGCNVIGALDAISTTPFSKQCIITAVFCNHGSFSAFLARAKCR